MNDGVSAEKADNTPDISTDNPNPALSKKLNTRKKLVPIGFILVVAAWVLMMPLPAASMVCVVVGLIMSIIGVRIPAGPRRDFAITAIIAASVLILVYALFIGMLALI